MATMSPLRRRMIEDLTVRNLSPATQRSYRHAVAKFSRFFGRAPDRLGLEEVRAFQVRLVSSGISWPALNRTVCALRFFYGVTLGHREIPERIPYAREPRKLPEVLSADELVRFLEAVPSLKARAALTTAYAAGPRASEVVGLKVANIDSGRMVIRAKGAGYLLALKDNWPTRAEEVRLFFEREPESAFQTYQTTDGEHGCVSAWNIDPLGGGIGVQN